MCKHVRAPISRPTISGGMLGGIYSENAMETGFNNFLIVGGFYLENAIQQGFLLGLKACAGALPVPQGLTGARSRQCPLSISSTGLCSAKHLLCTLCMIFCVLFIHTICPFSIVLKLTVVLSTTSTKTSGHHTKVDIRHRDTARPVHCSSEW
jgi:hypothetical protein